MLKIILAIAIIGLAACTTDPKVYDYANTAKTQVYFTKTKDAFFYADLDLKEKEVGVTAYLYVTDDKTKAEGKNIWGSIGFGQAKMNKSDMITLHYTDKKFFCQDCISWSYGVATDVMKGGKNDVTTDATGNAVETVAAATGISSMYKSVYKWSCIKKFDTGDQYDYNEWNKWFKDQSTSMPIIGAWGYPKKDGKLKLHEARSPIGLNLKDGAGLAEIKKNTRDWTTPDAYDVNEDGVQVYFLRTGSAFFYANITPAEKSARVEATLYLKEEYATASKKDLWASVGFATDVMDQSDMITFHYTDQKFMCQDCHSVKYEVYADTAKGGKKDVTDNNKSEVEAVDKDDALWPWFRTKVKWDCNKAFDTGDSLDYNKWNEWYKAQATTTMKLIGAWGYPKPDDKKLKKHEARNLTGKKMVDGDGLVEIVGLGYSQSPIPSTPSPVSSSNYLSVVGAVLALLSFILLY